MELLRGCAERLVPVLRFRRRNAVWTQVLRWQQEQQLLQQQQQQQRQQQRRIALLGVGAAASSMGTLEGRIATANAIVESAKRSAERSPDASPTVLGQQPLPTGGALVVLPPSLSEVGARPPAKPRKRRG